ncbi:MAG: hypothetical protein Q4A05_10510, partial [Ruminococcus sp.]|nr:hypothetical protein [Ruminococcus sp.]
MKQRLKKIEPAEWFCIAVFAIAALFFFYEIYPIIFATHDDMRNYTLVRRHDLVANAIHSAKSGRISHLWNHLLLGFPFILNKVWFYKLVSYSTVLFDVGAMMYFCARHIDRRIAWLSGATFMAFATISASHNLFIAYAFCHQLPIALFFISLHLFMLTLDKPKWQYTAISCLLFLICCMIYEAYIPFLAIYAAAAAIKPDKKVKGFGAFLLWIIKAMIPLTITAVAYLIVYKLWQYAYPSTYAGTQIYTDEPFVSLKAFFTFPFAIFPLYHVARLADTAPVASIHSITVFGVVKALLISAAAVLIIPKVSEKLKTRNSLLLLVTGIFIPNLLTSVSKQHLDAFKRGAIEYVTSYYSYFFVILFVCTAVCLLYECVRDKNLRMLVLAFVCVTAFVSSLTADMTVDHWKNYYTTVDRRYKNFDRTVASEEITDCDSDWQIYAPDNGGIHYEEPYTLDYI